MDHNHNKSNVRLTNEEISKKFNNQFEMVLYAIKLAEEMIKTGRGPRVKTDVQNKAMLILQEILNNKDTFKDLNLEEISNAYHEGEFEEKPE